MYDTYTDLEELCGTVSKELEKANKKIASSGSLSAGDVDYVDKLTHTLKSIKTTMAMIEADEGYSSAPYDRTYGTSYARGRRNAPRDSMGRYSGEDRRYSERGAERGYSSRYSRDNGMADDLREMMQDAPNDTIRRELQKVIDKIENM